MTEQLLHRLAFASYRSINIDSAQRFAERGIDARAFFELSAGALAAQTGVKSDYFSDSRRKSALDEAMAEQAFITDSGITPIYFADTEAYPERLAQCPDAPAMIFALGAPEVLGARHSVAIVGTRHCTPYGADFTRRLVADLAETVDDLLVVSGLAYGVDIAAHRAALDAGVPTAAVLAHGLNMIYPADHKGYARQIASDGAGVLLTEYTSTDRVHKGNFLARNRIVAGLADLTVVVESDRKGGAMSTARLASAYNREVMALPGRISDTYSRGCNSLIASGTAMMIRDADDLIDAMQWERRPSPGQQQTMNFDAPPQYAAVIDLLREHPGDTVNDMCERLGMPFARLSALLFEMEIDDYITALPGGRYALPAKAR